MYNIMYNVCNMYYTQVESWNQKFILLQREGLQLYTDYFGAGGRK